jgi:hypothetical protein
MKTRPALYTKTLLVAVPGMLLGAALLVVAGMAWLGALAVLLGAALFLGPWLLYPYSKGARRVLSPPDEDFERIERLADRLGRIPIFGRIWRFAERMTGNVGRTEAESYRRWRRERGE